MMKSFFRRTGWFKGAKWALALGVMALAVPSQALIWDADTVTSGAQNGAGTWDNTTANWWDGAADVAWSAGSDAVFGTGTGLATGGFTVTLNDNISLNNLTFNTGTNDNDKYTIAGSSFTLTFGANSTITTQQQNGTGGATISALMANASGSTLNIVNASTGDSTGGLVISGNNTGLLGNIVLGSGNGNGTITQINHVNALGSGPVSVVPDNTLRFGVAGTYTSAYTISGTGISGRGALMTTVAPTIAGNITLAGNSRIRMEANGGTTTFSGVISESGGSRTLDYRGVNNNTTVAVTGVNTYSGGTTVTASTAARSMTLAINSDSALGAVPVAPATNLTFDDASTTGTTILRADASFTLHANRNILLSSTTHTFNTNGNNLTVAGQISGDTPIIKSGTGTLAFSGNNNYTGTTTVNAGSLLIHGDQSAATGAVAVNNAATLGGTGTTGGAVTVANGGTLAPGASIGTFGTGALTLQSGSILALELNTSTIAADLLNVAGNLSITNGALLTLNDLGSDEALADGTLLTLMDYSGVWDGGLLTLGVNQLTDDELFSFGANDYTISYNGLDGLTTSITLEVVAVPEPSTYAMLVGGLGALWILRRKNRQA